jgi:tRNA pseudouridine55 synthase
MSRRQRFKGRNVSGILLLDKPAQGSSNRVLQTVKRIFNARKAGHTGSLDPLASGLLPICFGEATKFSNFLLNSDKAYRTECQLGVTTTTGDAEGEIVEQREVNALKRKLVEQILDSFLGPQTQVPPMYSALKHNGKPLYELARAGKTVEREPREITIHAIDLINFEDDRLLFSVACSKGTYIRTLVEDIGQQLGCGAHVTGLRRTAVGGFSLENAISLEKIQQIRDEQGTGALDACLLPMDAALDGWPGVRLSEDASFYMKQGQPVLVARAPTAGMVRLYDKNQEFMGIGHVLDDGRIAPKRLINLEQ